MKSVRQKVRAGDAYQRRAITGAFTLLELLVVIAIIGVIAGLLLPVLSRGKESAIRIQCLNQMRQIALAVRMHADENDDEFPRSQHSAFVHGQLAWGRAIAPQFGAKTTSWTNLLESVYHCPSDRRIASWSYGLNVYFELSPDDDYVGRPRTWRRVSRIPRPASTILFGESATAADHIMPNYWVKPADAVDVAAKRHRQKSNYAFVDGHAEVLPFSSTFDPPALDQWNPLQ